MKYELKDTKGRTHKLRLIGDKWVSKTTIFDYNLTPWAGEMVDLAAPPLYKLTCPNFDMEVGPLVQRKKGPLVQRKKGVYCLSTDEYLQSPAAEIVPYTQKDWDEIANDPDVKNKDFIESLLLSQHYNGYTTLTGAQNGDVL